MKQTNSLFQTLIVVLSIAVGSEAMAQETKPTTDGFKIKFTKSVKTTPEKAYDAFVKDFAKWWDASHSYSGKPENLSLDLVKRCMYEKLPSGGFVRHMEIVFHQPGKVLRLTGGLGPLQEMGVTGALTFKFTVKDGGTEIEMTYNVVGYSAQNLYKIEGPVKSVLDSQMERFVDFCSKNASKLAK